MTEYEQPRITNGGENRDQWSHDKIYDSFNPLNTTDAHSGSGDYAQIAQRWSSAVEQFTNRINHSSSAAWDGAAANSSRDAISKYAQRALDLSQPLQDLAAHVSSAIDGINNTRNSVDKPPAGGSWYNPRSWNLGVWHGPSSAAVRHDCENAARDAFQKDYVNTFVEADKQIPVLPVPSSPTDPLYTVPDEKPVSSGPNGPNGPTTGGDHTTSGPGAGGPTTSTHQQTGQPTDSTQSNTTPSSTTSPTTPSSAMSPSATTPSSVDPTANTSTTPSSFSGGLGGLGGSGLGGGGFSDGTTGSTQGGPGRSMPGTSAGAAATASRAATTSTGAGSQNMSGMGGMGGARGKSEADEATHDLPEWLRNMENAEELLGPQPKTIPGGVIGGDYGEPEPS